VGHTQIKLAIRYTYAKQSKDTSLFKTAMRINAPAIRRCGELLKEIKSATGVHLKKDGNGPLSYPSGSKRPQSALPMARLAVHR
jgi:hypothetical protein